MLKFILLAFNMLFVAYIHADEPEIKVVAQANLNVNKYVGIWYEIARLPIDNEENCIKNTNVEYTSYKNTLKVRLQCITADRTKLNINGVARFASPLNLAQLKINFSSIWVRWTKYGNMDYWILNTDYNNFAVVGSPDHEHLWIYSRMPKMNVKQLQNLVGFAQNSGYDISNLIYNKLSIE